jgi:microcystin-dependent protein
MALEPFIGEVTVYGFNFPPRGWATCDGQLLSIQQNTALFSLLGTIYGGNGTTNFALPDLRGRVPIHFGQGPGLSNYFQGQTGGSETVNLLTSQIPAHNHTYNAVSDAGDVSAPAGAYLANTGALDKEYKTTGTVVAMNVNAVGAAGGGQPHNNMQPYVVLNFSIALQGIFPSRN